MERFEHFTRAPCCHPKSLDPQPNSASKSRHDLHQCQRLGSDGLVAQRSSRNRMEQSTTKHLLIRTIFKKCSHPIFPRLHFGL